jgi:hypothetical protein
MNRTQLRTFALFSCSQQQRAVLVIPADPCVVAARHAGVLCVNIAHADGCLHGQSLSLQHTMPIPASNETIQAWFNYESLEKDCYMCQKAPIHPHPHPHPHPPLPTPKGHLHHSPPLPNRKAPRPRSTHPRSTHNSTNMSMYAQRHQQHSITCAVCKDTITDTPNLLLQLLCCCRNVGNWLYIVLPNCNTAQCYKATQQPQPTCKLTAGTGNTAAAAAAAGTASSSAVAAALAMLCHLSSPAVCAGPLGPFCCWYCE